ncbi:hypothetical protein CBR_g50140 [Chara braunii]|uniref:AP2/ERF domain-containing protein n=1 Tax=Chara braunii TaxID=69332 RepID=A0A388M628_CHABU|nr:hypothetical protein CBR_g50140 [Chara braunii]|eukprot:GBG90047.1 hypothetical protein CBR_g50140 [Chara braunii]
MVSIRYNTSSYRGSSSINSGGLKMDGVTMMSVAQPGAMPGMDVKCCSESPKALKEDICSFSLGDSSERLEDSRKRKGWSDDDDDVVHKMPKYNVYEDGVTGGGALMSTKDMLLDSDPLSNIKFDFGEEKIYEDVSPRDPSMYFATETVMMEQERRQQSPGMKSVGGMEEDFLFGRGMRTVDVDCSPSFGAKHSAYTPGEMIRWSSLELKMPWEEEKTFVMQDAGKLPQSGELEDNSPIAEERGEEPCLDVDPDMDADDVPEVLTGFDDKDADKDHINREPEHGWGLPFDVGDEVESRSFQQGFRGAWFECKVVKKEIWQGRRRAKLSYKDFSAEGEHWVCVYQVNHTIRKNQDKQRKELMIRPKPPPQVLEGNEDSLAGMQGMAVIAKPKWEVGDLVDARIDWCWWTGRVKKLNPDGTLVAEVDMRSSEEDMKSSEVEEKWRRLRGDGGRRRTGRGTGREEMVGGGVREVGGGRGEATERRGKRGAGGRRWTGGDGGRRRTGGGRGGGEVADVERRWREEADGRWPRRRRSGGGGEEREEMAGGGEERERGDGGRRRMGGGGGGEERGRGNGRRRREGGRRRRRRSGRAERKEREEMARRPRGDWRSQWGEGGRQRLRGGSRTKARAEGGLGGGEVAEVERRWLEEADAEVEEKWRRWGGKRERKWREEGGGRGEAEEKWPRWGGKRERKWWEEGRGRGEVVERRGKRERRWREEEDGEVGRGRGEIGDPNGGREGGRRRPRGGGRAPFFFFFLRRNGNGCQIGEVAEAERRWWEEMSGGDGGRRLAIPMAGGRSTEGEGRWARTLFIFLKEGSRMEGVRAAEWRPERRWAEAGERWRRRKGDGGRRWREEADGRWRRQRSGGGGEERGRGDGGRRRMGGGRRRRRGDGGRKEMVGGDGRRRRTGGGGGGEEMVGGGRREVEEKWWRQRRSGGGGEERGEEMAGGGGRAEAEGRLAIPMAGGRWVEADRRSVEAEGWWARTNFFRFFLKEGSETEARAEVGGGREEMAGGDGRRKRTGGGGGGKEMAGGGGRKVAFPKPPDGEAGEDTVEAKYVRASIDWVNGDWSIRTVKGGTDRTPSGRLVQLPLESRQLQKTTGGSGFGGDSEETGMRTKYSRRLKSRKFHNGVFQHEPSDSENPEGWATMEDLARNPPRRSKVTKRVVDCSSSSRSKFVAKQKGETHVQPQQSTVSVMTISDDLEGKDSRLKPRPSGDEGSPQVTGSEQESERAVREWPVHEGGEVQQGSKNHTGNQSIKQASAQLDATGLQSGDQAALVSVPRPSGDERSLQTWSAHCPPDSEERGSQLYAPRRPASSQTRELANGEGVGEQQGTEKSISLNESRASRKQLGAKDDAELIPLDIKKEPECSPVTPTVGPASHSGSGVMCGAGDTVRDWGLVEDQTRVCKTGERPWTGIASREFRTEGRGSLCSHSVDTSSYTAGLDKVSGKGNEKLIDDVLQRSSRGHHHDEHGKEDVTEATSGALRGAMEINAAETLGKDTAFRQGSSRQEFLEKEQTQIHVEEDFCVTSSVARARARDEDDDCLTAVDFNVFQKTTEHGANGIHNEKLSGPIAHIRREIRPSRKGLSVGAAGIGGTKRSRQVVAGRDGNTSAGMLEKDEYFQKGGDAVVSAGVAKVNRNHGPSARMGRGSSSRREKGYSSPKPPGRRYRRKHFFSRFWLASEQRELCLGPFVNQAAAQHAFEALSKCAGFIGSDSIENMSERRCGVFYRLFDGGTTYVGSEKVVVPEEEKVVVDGRRVAHNNTPAELLNGGEAVEHMKGDDISKLTRWERILQVTEKAANSPSSNGDRMERDKVVPSSLDLNVPSLEMTANARCDGFEEKQDWNAAHGKHQASTEGRTSAALRGAEVQTEAVAGRRSSGMELAASTMGDKLHINDGLSSNDVLTGEYPANTSQIRRFQVKERRKGEAMCQTRLAETQGATRDSEQVQASDGVDTLLFAGREQAVSIEKTGGVLAEMDGNLVEAGNEGEGGHPRGAEELDDDRRCTRKRHQGSSGGNAEKYSVPEDQLVWKVCSGRKRFAHVISYRGVYMHKDGWFYYRSRVHGGSRIRYGRYSTAEEAAHGYDEHVKKFHGKSVLNFPEGKKRSMNARSPGPKHAKDWQVEGAMITGRIGKPLGKPMVGAGEEGPSLSRLSSRRGKGMRKHVDELEEEVGLAASAMNAKEVGRRKKWRGAGVHAVKGGMDRGSPSLDVYPEVSISAEAVRRAIAKGGKEGQGADEALNKLLRSLLTEVALKDGRRVVGKDNGSMEVDGGGTMLSGDGLTAGDRSDLLRQREGLLLQKAGALGKEKAVPGTELQPVLLGCAGEKKAGEKPRRGGRRKFKGWGRKGKRCGPKKKASDLQGSDDLAEVSGHMESTSKVVQRLEHYGENMTRHASPNSPREEAALRATANANNVQMVAEAAAARTNHDNQATAEGPVPAAATQDAYQRQELQDEGQAAAALLQAGGRSVYDDDQRVKRRCARARFTSNIPCVWDTPVRKDFFNPFKGCTPGGMPPGSGCTLDRVGSPLIGESSIIQRIIDDECRGVPALGGEGSTVPRAPPCQMGLSEAGGRFSQEKTEGGDGMFSPQTPWFSNPVFPKSSFPSHSDKSSPMHASDGMENRDTIPWPRHHSSSLTEVAANPLLDPDTAAAGPGTPSPPVETVVQVDSASDSMVTSRVDCALAQGSDVGVRALQSQPFIPRMFQQMSSDVPRRITSDMSRMGERGRAGELTEGTTDDNMRRGSEEMWNVNIYYDGIKKHSTGWFNDYSNALDARDAMIDRIRKMGDEELGTAVQGSPATASGSKNEAKGAERSGEMTNHQTIEWELVDSAGNIVCCGSEELEWKEKPTLPFENGSDRKAPEGIQRGRAEVGEEIPGKQKQEMVVGRDDLLGNPVEVAREAGPEDQEVQEGTALGERMEGKRMEVGGGGNQEVGQLERQERWEDGREGVVEGGEVNERYRTVEGEPLKKQGMHGGGAEMQPQPLDEVRHGERVEKWKGIERAGEEARDGKQCEERNCAGKVERQTEGDAQCPQDSGRMQRRKGVDPVDRQAQSEKTEAGEEEFKGAKSDGRGERVVLDGEREEKIQERIEGRKLARGDGKEDADRRPENDAEVRTEGLRGGQEGNEPSWKGIAGRNDGWLRRKDGGQGQDEGCDAVALQDSRGHFGLVEATQDGWRMRDGRMHEDMGGLEGLQDRGGSLIPPADASKGWLRKDGQRNEQMSHLEGIQSSLSNLRPAGCYQYPEVCPDAGLGEDQRGQIDVKPGLNRGKCSDHNLPSMLVDSVGSCLVPDEGRTRQGNRDDSLLPLTEKGGRRKGHIPAKHRRAL